MLKLGRFNENLFTFSKVKVLFDGALFFNGLSRHKRDRS